MEVSGEEHLGKGCVREIRAGVWLGQCAVRVAGANPGI